MNGFPTYYEYQAELLIATPFEGIFLLLEDRRHTCSILWHDFLLDKNVVDQAVNDMRPDRSI
jgi:hypothetical protein